MLSDSTVVSVWDSIILDHEGAEVDQECACLCLHNIVKMYVRVRSFSHAKDIFKSYQIEQKLAKKQKSLRKGLKLQEKDSSAC